MRKLFIVVAKLMGFWQLFLMVIFLIQVGINLDSLLAAARAPGSSVQYFFEFTLSSSIVSIILSFGLSWFLLIKTGWLADKFKIKERDNLPAFNADRVLRGDIHRMGS